MNSPVSGEGQVSVSFTDEPNATRAFFDPTSMTEAREIAAVDRSVPFRHGGQPDRKA